MTGLTAEELWQAGHCEDHVLLCLEGSHAS